MQEVCSRQKLQYTTQRETFKGENIHGLVRRKGAFVGKTFMECICEIYEELLEQSNLPSLETAYKTLPSLQEN